MSSVKAAMWAAVVYWYVRCSFSCPDGLGAEGAGEIIGPTNWKVFEEVDGFE